MEYVVNPIRVGVLYKGHQERKNKWENRAKAMKEQRKKKMNATFKELTTLPNVILLWRYTLEITSLKYVWKRYGNEMNYDVKSLAKHFIGKHILSWKYANHEKLCMGTCQFQACSLCNKYWTISASKNKVFSVKNYVWLYQLQQKRNIHIQFITEVWERHSPLVLEPSLSVRRWCLSREISC